ncbi:MAG: hypothetical protein JO069_17485 [Verrucomicrobia bacterium]|nr:hypothetical protein [Verrucomicrobiota bacterium]
MAPSQAPEDAGRQVELMGKESVGVPRLDPVRRQGSLGEVFQVLRDDGVAAADDGRRQDVAAVPIRQRKRRVQSPVARDEAVARLSVHEGARALKGRARSNRSRLCRELGRFASVALMEAARRRREI